MGQIDYEIVDGSRTSRPVVPCSDIVRDLINVIDREARGYIILKEEQIRTPRLLDSVSLATPTTGDTLVCGAADGPYLCIDGDE